jgi:hypothetical protein
MMEREVPDDRDPVWSLLARARDTKVSPHFSRNVVRAARQSQGPESGLHGWLHAVFAPRWRLAAAVATVSLIIGLAIRHQWPNEAPVTGIDATRAPMEAEATDELGDQLMSELAMLDEIDHLLEATDAGELDDVQIEWLLF